LSFNDQGETRMAFRTRLQALLLACAGLLATLLPALLAAAEPNQYVLSATGSVEIGPDGAVHDYALDNELAPPIAAAIDRHVRGWRFEPVTVDGRPVIAKSRMRLGLSAVPVGEDLQLRVDHVSFGGAAEPSDEVKREHPLRYPRQALEARLGARVLLAVRTDEHGNVVEVHPYQTSLSRRMSDAEARRWRGVFEKAAAGTVAKWTFAPGQIVDGAPVAGTFIMPFEFTIGSRPLDPDAWRAYVPGPVSPAPWFSVAPDQSARVAALAEGESVSLDSRLVLRDAATPTRAPET
jgi:hypothetical protein